MATLIFSQFSTFRYQVPGTGPRSSPQYNRMSGDQSDSNSSRSPSPPAHDTLEFITNLGEDNSESTSATAPPYTSQPTLELPPHLKMSTKPSSASSNWFVSEHYMIDGVIYFIIVGSSSFSRFWPL